MRKVYQSDLSDNRWAAIKPLLPAALPGGRPREVNLREIVNAIFYVNRTGCSWRDIPGDFPHWQTVYTYFRNWRDSGVWKKNQRLIEETFAKARRSRISGNRWSDRLANSENEHVRRFARLRWGKKDPWPEAPYLGGHDGAADGSGCALSGDSGP